MHRKEASKRALEERGYTHFRRQLSVQWVILAVALLALGCGVAYFLRESYVELLESQGGKLLHQTRVIDKNLSHQLNLADDILKLVAERFVHRDREGSAQGLDLFLQDIDAATAGIRAVSVLDTEGFVVNSSRIDLIGKNFRDRDYFKAAVNDPDRTRLHILPPFKTIFGYYAMPATRAVIGPRGEPLGVVSVSLDPEFFTTLISSVLFSPDMWGGIAHSNGTLFLLTPQSVEAVIGKDLAVPGSLFLRHRESGLAETLFTGVAYTTGEMRMIAQRDVRSTKSPSDGYLVVGISSDPGAVHAGWREVAVVMGGSFGALALFSILGLAYYQRRQREARDSLLERERELLAALTEVKTLSGLLPICSSCHKIRDDQGYWNILEKYICDHSRAEFTHGICPDCIKKLYPEYGDGAREEEEDG